MSIDNLFLLIPYAKVLASITILCAITRINKMVSLNENTATLLKQGLPYWPTLLSHLHSRLTLLKLQPTTLIYSLHLSQKIGLPILRPITNPIIIPFSKYSVVNVGPVSTLTTITNSVFALPLVYSLVTVSLTKDTSVFITLKITSIFLTMSFLMRPIFPTKISLPNRPPICPFLHLLFFLIFPILYQARIHHPFAQPSLLVQSSPMTQLRHQVSLFPLQPNQTLPLKLAHLLAHRPNQTQLDQTCRLIPWAQYLNPWSLFSILPSCILLHGLPFSSIILKFLNPNFLLLL